MAKKVKRNSPLSVRVDSDIVDRYTAIADGAGLVRNKLFVDALELYLAVLESGRQVVKSPSLSTFETES